MSKGTANPFSANASLTGYLYQCLYALLDSLRRLREFEPFAVSIETLDDVVFEADEGCLELLQTKHHVNREASLTDASPDLWKTLRIWCEGLTADNLPADTTFALITTAVAPEGAAASYYREQGILNIILPPRNGHLHG